LRKAFSVTVALIALMVCTTLVASGVSAAPVGTVGMRVIATPPNFFTMLQQWIMHFVQLFHFHCGMPTPMPTAAPR